MRVILFGYYGFGNAGDEAMLAGLLHGLRALGPAGAEYLVLSGNPKETEELHGVAARPRNAVRELLRASGADAWIFGGGSLLQDVTGPFTLPFYLGVMCLVTLRRRPFALHAQGVGPIDRRLNRTLTGCLVRQAVRISVRDADAKETLARLGVDPDRVHVGADLAFLLPARKAGRAPGTTVRVGVALREWGQTERWLPEIAGGLERFLDQAAGQAVLVPMDPADEPLARRVASRLAGRAAVAAAGVPYNEKLRVLSGSDLVLAMRLHAGVFAALGHVPTVFVAYDPKVRALAERLDAPALDLGDVTAERVASALAVTWRERNTRREALARTVGRLRAAAEEDLRGLVRTLFRLHETDEEWSPA